jgi:STE24 endopeptidase
MGVAGLFTAGQVERARRYHQPLYLATATGVALELALFGLLSFTAIGNRLYAGVSDWPWWPRALAFALLVLAIGRAVDLPLAFWAGYLHEHRWGFSTQTLGGWLLDRVKGLALALAFGALGLLGLVGAARLWPSWWPVIAAAGAAVIILALGVLAPLLLEPLFNRFQPITDQQLAARLHELADRANLPVERILVADASRRTRKVNAYVSGLGRTRRLVLFDTLLADADEPEVELVVAHELGHRKRQHLAKLALLAILGAAVFVLLAWALLRWPPLLAALNASGPDDPRITPFLLFLGAALDLLASPPSAALSRHWERQADVFSIQLTHAPEAFVSTHRRLALSNLADLAPPRLAYLTWYSHPTPPERIATARTQQNATP